MASSPVNIHEFERLRPLGALEKFSSARHNLGFMLNVGLTASYRSNHPMNFPDLQCEVLRALAVVINRHPILSAIPVEAETSSPYFVRLPSINLNDSVTFKTRSVPTPSESESDVDVEQLLEEQHNLPFTAHLPHWRLVILISSDDEYEFTAAFVYHHSLGDGASGLLFHKHFQTALSSTTPLPSTTIYPTKTPLLPSLEELHPLPIANSTPAPLPKALWTGRPISVPVISKFRSIVFTKQTSEKLLQACRVHGTTLTGIIPVVIASILVKELPEEFSELECLIPVNIRRWLPADVVNSETFGVWLDAISLFFTRTTISEMPWAEAVRTREAISDYLASDGQRISVAKFKAMPSMHKYFLSRLSKDRTSSFDVSNLGFVVPNLLSSSNIPEVPTWTTTRMVFSRAAFASGSAFSTSVVTGGDGCLVVGFSWQEGIIDAAMMGAVVNKVKYEVEQIAVGR